MTLDANKTPELAKKFGGDENNVGAVEVQIAILTERISSLESHFKSHKRDNHSRRGLIIMVSKRRKLIKYLMKRDYDGYKKLIDELGIRRQIKNNNKYQKENKNGTKKANYRISGKNLNIRNWC